MSNKYDDYHTYDNQFRIYDDNCIVLVGSIIKCIIKSYIESKFKIYSNIKDISIFNKQPKLTEIIYTPIYCPETSGWGRPVRNYYDKILENFKKLQNKKIQLNNLKHKLVLESLKVGCIVENSGPTIFSFYYTDKYLISINFEGIENFTKLKKLHLINVYITPDNYEQLSKSNIEEIIIETSFSDDSFKFLSNIKTLKSITFDKIGFKNIDDCADIFKLPLEKIIINHSSITNKSPFLIKKIDSYLLFKKPNNKEEKETILCELNNYIKTNINNNSTEELIKYVEETINNVDSMKNYAECKNYIDTNNVYDNIVKLTNHDKCGELFFSSMNNCKTLKKCLLNYIIKYKYEYTRGFNPDSIYDVKKYMTNIPFTIIGKDVKDIKKDDDDPYYNKKDLNKPFIIMNSFYYYNILF